MYPYLGDFPTGQTIYIPFHTFDSNDPTASVTISGLALADIKVYKDGGVTQRSSTAGFTLLDTDGIDFDALTGIHGISIDTSDNTDPGFWAAGSDYWVIIDSITVDAATVRFIAATFSIDNRGLLRPTTAQRTLDVTATGAAGIDWGNVENQSTSVDLSATSTNLVDTCTTNTDMVAAAPTAAQNADAVWDELQSAHVTAGSFGVIASEIADILVDTAQIGAAGAGLTAIPWNAAWDAEVQSEVTDALNAYDPPTKAEMDTGFAAVPTATENADALLNRDMSAVSDTTARSPLNALRFLRNKWSVSGTTLTVTKEDDSTSAWTATVTTDATADPITGNDPA